MLALKIFFLVQSQLDPKRLDSGVAAVRQSEPPTLSGLPGSKADDMNPG
jgi:hypothetical protein